GTRRASRSLISPKTMARSRSTSKKPSAASSSRRRLPEPLVFFIDRSLGRKKVPEALRAAGLEVRVHDELFPQGTQDVVWLSEAGANGWVVVTRDDRIRYNQLEKQARPRRQAPFLQHHILVVDRRRGRFSHSVCRTRHDAPMPAARGKRLH